MALWKPGEPPPPVAPGLRSAGRGALVRRWSSIVWVGLGLLVMLVPVRGSRPVGWSLTDGDFAEHPFTASAAFDPAAGAITSSDGEIINGDLIEPGMAFEVSGSNGSGWVEVEVTEPGGATLLRWQVAPGQPFLTHLAWFDRLGVRLVLAPAETGSRDQLRGRLSISNVDPTGPLTVAKVTLEIYSVDFVDGRTELPLDDRPYGCAALVARLPIVVEPLGAVSCVFGVPAAIPLWTMPDSSPPAAVALEVGEAAGFPIGVETRWASDATGGLDESGYPNPPPELNPPSFTEPIVPGDLTGGFSVDAPGVYVVTVRSDEGSPGFQFEVTGSHPSSGPAVSRFPAAGLVGGLWVAAALTLLIGPRLGGLVLSAAGLTVAASLAAGSHAWYWATPYALVSIAAAVSAAVGLALVVPSSHATWRSVLKVLLTGCALLAGVLAVATGLGGRAYLSDTPPFVYNYNGDYMILGTHIAGVILTVALSACAGAAWGSHRAATGA